MRRCIRWFPVVIGGIWCVFTLLGLAVGLMMADGTVFSFYVGSAIGILGGGALLWGIMQIIKSRSETRGVKQQCEVL